MKTAKEVCEEIKNLEINLLIDLIKNNNAKLEIRNFRNFKVDGVSYREHYNNDMIEISGRLIRMPESVKRHESKLKELGYLVNIKEDEIVTARPLYSWYRTSVELMGPRNLFEITISACCGET